MGRDIQGSRARHQGFPELIYRPTRDKFYSLPFHLSTKVLPTRSGRGGGERCAYEFIHEVV